MAENDQQSMINIRPAVLASHQPDFLPYSGFFYKMDKAEVFDLAIFDQYTRSGYQRRVTMGGKWVGLEVSHEYDRSPIWQVQYNRASAQKVMDAIYQNYHHLPYYHRYVGEIMHILAAGEGILFKLNVELIHTIAAMLGIQVILGVATPLHKPKGHGILELMEHYDMNAYLSGTGAKEYIGDEFEKANKQIIWSKHQPETGDSILELLFKYGDKAIDHVRAEHE
jgi:hypothetical protein